jgi:hypothetical protein
VVPRERDGVVRVVIIEIGSGSLDGFEHYERAVLGLLDRHGGRLDRRLRSVDDRVEVHLLAFDSATGYQAFLDDPERAALRPLLAGLDVRTRVLQVRDVPAGRSSPGPD